MNRTDSTRYSIYRLRYTDCQFGSFTQILFWNWQQYIFDERPRYELPIDPFLILQDRKTIEKRSPCIVNNILSLARIDYTFRQKFMGSYEPLFPKLNSGRKILRTLRKYTATARYDHGTTRCGFCFVAILHVVGFIQKVQQDKKKFRMKEKICCSSIQLCDNSNGKLITKNYQFQSHLIFVIWKA